MLRAAAGVLGNPLLMASLIVAAGLLFLRGRRRRMGMSIMAAGALFAYAASTSLVGNLLLAPLEQAYPPFDETQAIGVRDIVVLGSGYEPEGHIPVTGALDADGLVRIAEGVRLTRARPDSRLLVSGGAPPGYTPAALGYAQFASELGVQPSALVVMDRAHDTDAEARDVAAFLGSSPFILVTSAYHMPRAMQLMRRAGASPLAAPTGQILHARHGAELFGVIAGSRGLRKTETALHEYFGLAAIKLRIDRAEDK